MANNEDTRTENLGRKYRKTITVSFDPLKAAIVVLSVVLSAVFVFGGWYTTNVVDMRLDKQSAEFQSLSEKFSKVVDEVNKVEDELSEHGTKVVKVDLELIEQLKSNSLKTDGLSGQLEVLALTLHTKVDGIDQRITQQIESLRDQVNSDLANTEEKAKMSEEKIEQELAKIPVTEGVVEELGQHTTDIETINQEVDSNERKLNLLDTLVQLGVDHPVLRKTLQVFAEKNPEFGEQPERLVTLWGSKTNQTATEFVDQLLAAYDIDKVDAMILAFDELTESKPIRFFVDAQEMIANAEPKFAAAKPLDDEINVPLAKPLSIVRVCSEMPKTPTVECYKYFLDYSNDMPADLISFESPSDDAVIKLIVEKHETQIAGS